jgi:acid phosphatase type 7
MTITKRFISIQGNMFKATGFYLVLILSGAHLSAQPSQPSGIMLTWQQDPSTTMTIDWHTTPEDAAESVLRYKLQGSDQWTSVQASTHDFPYSDRAIHRVELTGLQPASSYRFRVGEFERAYRFETMSLEMDRQIRFATGGDVMHDAEWMAQTNRQAMKYDPDFIAWGGDLAYPNARHERVERWYDFFEVIRETLIHEDGRVVPVIVSIGNHEVEQRYVYRYFGRTDERRFQDTDEWRAAEAPYFYALFAFPGPRGYNVLDFGDYLSMVALDSYHTNLIAGDQINWLHETLSDRRHVPHVFPFYHVPVWASVKGLEYSNEQREVRMHFPSVFEKYGIRVAFENHDHAYKRTPPMRGGEAVGPDEGGVVYIGDGAWGVSTREHVRHLRADEIYYVEDYDITEIRERAVIEDIEDIWFLEEFASARHFILATLDGERQHFLVVDEDGNIIDEYTEDDFRPSFTVVTD